MQIRDRVHSRLSSLSRVVSSMAAWSESEYMPLGSNSSESVLSASAERPPRHDASLVAALAFSTLLILLLLGLSTEATVRKKIRKKLAKF